MRTPPPRAPPWLLALALALPCFELAVVLLPPFWVERMTALPLPAVVPEVLMTTAPTLTGALVPPVTTGTLVAVPPVLPSPMANAAVPAVPAARSAAPTAATMPLRAFIRVSSPFCLAFRKTGSGRHADPSLVHSALEADADAATAGAAMVGSVGLGAALLRVGGGLVAALGLGAVDKAAAGGAGAAGADDNSADVHRGVGAAGDDRDVGRRATGVAIADGESRGAGSAGYQKRCTHSSHNALTSVHFSSPVLSITTLEAHPAFSGRIGRRT